MLGGLLTFLVGCLVLAVILYVVNLVMGLIELPAQIKQIALIIIGLIALVLLIYLAIAAMQGGGPSLGLPGGR